MLKFNFFQLKFVSGGALGGALKTSSGGALFKKSQKWGALKKVPPGAPPVPPHLGNPAVKEGHKTLTGVGKRLI